MHVVSSLSWLGNPHLFGVIVDGKSADHVERCPVPHVLRVVPRPDSVNDLPGVISVERRGWSEAAEYLRAAGRIGIRVVIPAHVHPQLVVSPRPLRDVLLGHYVRKGEHRWID